MLIASFCGVFGSSGPALGVATIADIFSPEERGRPISVYALGPMVGLSKLNADPRLGQFSAR